MTDLKVASVVLSLKARVPKTELEQQMPIEIDTLAGDLAVQVMQYVRAEKLGYYPALEFFRSHGGIDVDAFDLAEQVAWLAAEAMRKALRVHLRGIFSTVRVEGLQSLAFTLPRIRVGQANAETLLTQHFDPSMIKADLRLSLLQRKAASEGLEGFSKRMVSRWLGPQVEALEVTNARLLK